MIVFKLIVIRIRYLIFKGNHAIARCFTRLAYDFLSNNYSLQAVMFMGKIWCANKPRISVLWALKSSNSSSKLIVTSKRLPCNLYIFFGPNQTNGSTNLRRKKERRKKDKEEEGGLVSKVITVKKFNFRRRTKMWTLERQCHYEFIVLLSCVFLLLSATRYTKKTH